MNYVPEKLPEAIKAAGKSYVRMVATVAILIIVCIALFAALVLR